MMFRAVFSFLIVTLIVSAVNAFAPISRSVVHRHIRSSQLAMTEFDFTTKFFPKDAVNMAGTTEYVVKGGTHLYPKVCKIPQH